MDLSVILPIYNCKKEMLKNCLQSIFTQKKVTLEIICIDDGSTNDTVLEIEKLFVDKDNAVLIRSEHRGVAYARNLGIKRATGKYIAFIDADDYYPENDVLARLFNAAEESGAKIVGGSFSDCTDGVINTVYSGELSGYKFDKDGWYKFSDYQFDFGFHRFLFERQFLIENNIFFPPFTRYQDPPFLVNALHKAGEFLGISKVVYCYRNHDKAISWNTTKVVDCVKALTWMFQFAMNNSYWKLYELTISRSMWQLGDVLKEENYFQDRIVRKEVGRMIDQCIDNYSYKWLDYGTACQFDELREQYVNTNLTIVVPAYNVEKYIEQCLESIVNQTNKSFYVVIVDDGSKDRTKELCMDYVQWYPGLFKYVYQENAGLGAARNKGLEYVYTKYVTFLDSDDWLDIRFAEKINSLLASSGEEPDLIISLPQCYNEASKQIEDWMDRELFLDIQSKSNGKSISVQDYPELYWLEVNANRKIYNTEFLNKINFNFSEGVKWEDIRPHVQAVHSAKSCLLCSETGFVYRTNNSNQITAGRGKSRLDFIYVFNETIKCMEGAAFSSEEVAYVIDLLCKYATWMIDMTDTETIDDLLFGLHDSFSRVNNKLLQYFFEYDWKDYDRCNQYRGLISCLRSYDYLSLKDYVNRQNLYRYWRLNAGKKKNLLMGGLQCIKDSGLKYTLSLLMKKIKYQGF